MFLLSEHSGLMKSISNVYIYYVFYFGKMGYGIFAV